MSDLRDWDTPFGPSQVPETCKENADSFTDDLAEAAEKYRRESYKASMIPREDGTINRYAGSIKGAFIAGAKWQKTKMMRDAVDYKIVNNLAAYPVIYYEVNHLGLKYGDKVKLIIVKDDD